MNPRKDEKQPGVSIRLYSGESHDCPYLPGLTARDEFTVCDELDPAIYHTLMDHRFRRSGRIVYRPVCDGCSECIPIRVPVDRFVASKSQARVARRNADVVVELGRPVATDEKWRIYTAYLAHQHDGTMSTGREDFERFLYQSPTATLEMSFRIGRRLAGVGIVDVTPACLSSVYFYFDPEFRKRSLGIFSALQEIARCRALGLPYWYCGFFVAGCSRMNYKAQFRPYELLCADGRWREPGESSPTVTPP